MTKIRILLQEFLKISTIFLLIFVWIRYFIRNFFIAFAVSGILTIVFYILFFIITRKNKKRYDLKIKEKEEAQNIFITISLKKNAEQTLKKIAQKILKVTSSGKNYVLCQSSVNNNIIGIYFDDDIQGFSAQKLFEIHNFFKKKNAKKVIVLCKEISDKNVSTFLGLMEIEFVILDQYETYEKIYKKYQIIPEIEHKIKKNKTKFSDIIAYSFNKKRTKGYLFSAFLLIISGIFVKATLYYCIISSLLLVFAIISFFNPKFNNKKTELF